MSGPTILAVDDNEDDILLLQMAFRSTGAVDLVVAAHGEEALAKLGNEGEEREGAVLPDLLLVDLNMPGMTGFELMERVRARNDLNGVRIVIFSSSQHQEDIRRGYEGGADHYLMKPLDFAELVEVARGLVRMLGAGDPSWPDIHDLPCHRPMTSDS